VIAYALALWAIEQRPAASVRAACSPQRAFGFDTITGWVSLRRWARAARSLWGCIRAWPARWTARRVAERVAATLAAHAPVATSDLAAAAFFGGVHAR
jgi:hypothetical protein